MEYYSDFAELWAVVANAGLGGYGYLEWVSTEKVQKLFDVNVFGVLRTFKAFAPLLRKSKGEKHIGTLDEKERNRFSCFVFLSFKSVLTNKCGDSEFMPPIIRSYRANELFTDFTFSEILNENANGDIFSL